LQDTLAHFACYPASVAELGSVLSLNIYPNPASTTIKIEASTPLEYIRIYNMLGQVLERFVLKKEKSITISVADFPKGLYFLEVNNTLTKKFFKE
jgi:hypothetical protein